MNEENISQKDHPSEDPIECDVCIVGSGAAGCVLAHELSQKGKKVILLEKGSHYTQDWIEQNKKDESRLSDLWKNKGVFLSQNFSVNISQGQCVGGSTMINYGICFKIPDEVFSHWKDTFGIQISKEKLEDAYTRVRNILKINKIDEKYAGISHVKLKEGCDKLGYSGDWMDKSYIPGKGKQSAYNAFLLNADFSNLTLYANCNVKKITKKGGKIDSVIGRFKNESGDMQKLTIHPKEVVISAGVIASSELLLQNNIANSNKQVGKHLSLHPSSSVVAEFDHEINADEGIVMAYYCDEFSIHKVKKPGFMIESVFVPPSQYSITAPSFGKENKEYLKAYNNSAMAGVLVHDEPSGTISLNWSNDAIVDYQLSETDQQKMLDGMKEATRVFLRAGAKRVITGHILKTEIRNSSDIKLIDKRGAGVGAVLIASVHPQGGNRMGEDKSISVVNSQCQSHEISNLYVCDASIFPTSIGVNPQWTVMAIAILTADYISSQ